MTQLRASPEKLSGSVYGSLGDGVRDFLAEHSENWTVGMAQKTEAYLNVMLEFFGFEKSLSEINRQDAKELKKALQKLPANRKTKPQTKHLSLREAVALKDVQRIGTKTVNSHIETFQRFFIWAERNGYAPKKLFDGIKIANAKKSELKRMPFSSDEVSNIYLELTENRKGYVKTSYQKWGALLGLFTGARLNEIAQLNVADIKQADDIWYFDINDDGKNQRLKSNAAKRKIPIHIELIRIGFLEYVKKQKPSGQLFPELRYTEKDGYGRKISRWFNGTFLIELGYKKAGVSFHCLRHTMVSRLAKADVQNPIIKQLLGHERDGVTQQVYNKEGYTLTQVSDALEKFEIQ